MGERNEALVTEAELAELDGGGNESGGEAPGVLDRKFGGDVDKLADAYSNLERKIGEQGQELGTLRQQINDGPAKKETAVTEEDFVAALEKKLEDGEISQLQATQAYNKFREKSVSERLDQSDARAVANERRAIWQDYAASSEDLQKSPVLEKVMLRIAQQKPHLLVMNKTPGDLKSSFDDLLELAKLEVSKAMASRGGSLDDGRSRRVVRTETRSSGRGGKVGGESLQRALDSDNERDWGKALEDILG